MKYALAAVLLCPLSAFASSFERFDAPGAEITCGGAIASNGLVAGASLASPIAIGTSAQPRKAVLGGFLYRSGRFLQPKPAVPAGMVTFTGVNRAAEITGIDIDKAALATQTFLYTHRTTRFPTITQGNVVTLSAVNDAGTILGTAATSSGPLQFGYIGFLQTAAGATTIIDDGSNAAQPSGMDETARYVVGTSFTQNLGGWLFHDGAFTAINVPGSTYTLPRGVTSKAVVTGSYLTGSGSTAVAHGFRYEHGTYKTIDIPGADATQIGGMNESGQITGCFTKAGRTHGFLYTP